MPLPDPLPGWLAPGSLVKLVSGGPAMTVVEDTLIPVGKNMSGGADPVERKVSVTWFEGGGRRMEAKLPRGTIAPAPGDAIAERVAQHVFERSVLATVLEGRIDRALLLARQEGATSQSRLDAMIGTLDPARMGGGR
jgi:uncharacterized protein YodC (DUF2158 family)